MHIDLFELNSCIENLYILIICLMFEIKQILILKGDLKLFFYPNVRCYIWRVVYISCGMVVRHRWHFHGSFHLQKIIVQNQYYTRWYNKGGSRMTLRRTSIRDYFMECVDNQKTLLQHLWYSALSSSMHLVLLDWWIVSQLVTGRRMLHTKYKKTTVRIWHLLKLNTYISDPYFWQCIKQFQTHHLHQIHQFEINLILLISLLVLHKHALHTIVSTDLNFKKVK